MRRPATGNAAAAQARDRTATRLLRAEALLTRTVLTPYPMLVPTALVLGRFAHNGSLGSIVIHLVLLPTAMLALVLVVPFALAYQGFGALAYGYDQVERQSRRVDWAAARWADIRRLVTAHGVDTGSLEAVSVFSTTANLAVVHRPVQAHGAYGKLSDWSVRRGRPLLIAGAAFGVLVAVVGAVNPPWWRAVVTAAPVGAALVLPVSAVIIARTMPRMLRLNIRDPRLVLVIPTQWVQAFRRDPARAEVVLGHELSHVRHRDTLRRRLLSPYRTFAPILAFVASGVVSTARIPLVWQLSLFTIVATTGVLTVRRAYREITTVQELRADAEAARTARSAENLAAAVETLGGHTLSAAQAHRLAALRGDGNTAVRTAWRLALLNLVGFVLPIITIAVLVMTGVLPVDPTVID